MYTLFIIDDDSEVLDINTSYFQNEGYNVKCFKNADDAILALNKTTADCILLDVMMPGTNGFDALNIIKSCWKLDYLVLVSKDLKKFYTREMLKSRCKCIYIPNVVESIPRRLAKLENKKLISVGRLSPEKGYLDLLKIYNVLSKKYSDWTLDIIGDGVEKEKLEKFIKNNNLEDKVVLHGFQDKKYIDKMLNKSSIYVMTSHTESFGIVLIEAMSHGVPCIAYSSAEGAKEIINSGKNGYLIKNRNSKAYLKKIEDLIKKDDVRKKLGKEARLSVKKYTADVVKNEWYNLIEKK